jgi:hypothetical protein
LIVQDGLAETRDIPHILWGRMWGFEMGGAIGNRTPKKHPDKALTAIGVRALKTPGRYADGNGLYLKVSKSGAKRWELRTMVRGKRCDIGLGDAETWADLPVHSFFSTDSTNSS